jgi:leucyl aminopeptidase
VENSVSGNAMRPRDVLRTRKGLTVEIGNTDAEGRLVLADALTEAMAGKPDLLLDFATLTGAARSAVGTGIAAMFTPDDSLAEDLYRHGMAEDDPVWRMPLWKPYRRMIDSKVADINNAGDSPHAGAITAALFLAEFVDEGISWAHFDIMAWNPAARPGRPEGGEAMAMRAAFATIKDRYAGA